MNKYSNWYNNIINGAKDRVLAGYGEKHHIIPKSLNGTNDPSNLVQLTAREHFICHWLLTKMYSGQDHYKMVMALQMMKGNSTYQERYETPITSRVYENIRIAVGKAASKRNKGRKQPLYEKEKQLAAQIGRTREPFNDEWRANLSKAGSGKNNAMYGKRHTAEVRRKQSEKAKLRKHSEETRKKIGAAQLGSIKPKKHCPHCNQDIAVNGYARWHGDKCKSK